MMVGYIALLTAKSLLMLPCPLKKITGFECPGCGFQRSLNSLFEGDIWQSIEFFPALFPLLVLVSALGLHLTFKFKHGAAWLKWNFIVVAFLVLGNYILKLIL